MFTFLPLAFRRKGWLSLVLLLFYSSVAWSQAELQKIAPLSPNAASLLRYTETNISHYTGSASIGFPLHTMKSGSLNLDLSLNYSSTGNKVEDIASWVGLGWNLGTIPMVTRTVRSLPDEAYPGISVPYLGKKIQEIIEISNTAGHPSGLTGIMICQIANGELDTEPDYFHYTLLDGRSGYFYWDPYLEKYQTTPYRNFKITKTGAGSIDAIQIIDDNGNIYTFSDYETSQSSGTYNGPTTRNAWYVSTITNSNKTDGMSFGYNTHSVVTRTLNPMRKELNGFCPDNSSMVSTTTVQTKIPWMITTDEGSLTFIGADNFREDLNGSYALKSMEVRDNANNMLKKINFHYEYTTAVSDDPLCALVSSFTYEKKRLFLKSFAEMSLTGTDSVMHSFQYNNSIVAPCRVSSAQDFWGYYNGQSSNQNLIPEIPKGAVLLPQAAIGANRFVNPSVNQFGILNRINLPTGGYTEIEYETHQIRDSIGLFPAVYLTKGTYLLPEHEVSTNVFMDTISIYSDRNYFINNSDDGGSFVDITLGDHECVSDPPPAVNCAQLFIRGIDSWNSDVNFPVINNIQLYHLKKGRYELKAMFAQAPVNEQGFFMYLKWREVDTTFKNTYIGGLRVKQTKTVDNAGNVYTKRYLYTKELNSDTSSGQIISGTGLFRVQQANCPESNLANYIVADNSAMQTSHGGSFVGYVNVIELRDSLGMEGYAQYQYDHLKDQVSNIAPFVPAWDNSEFRGHLINTKIFAKVPSGFRLISEERNEYFYYLMDSLSYTAMKTFKVLNGIACDVDGGHSSGLLYWSEPYPYAPRISLLQKKRSIQFNQYNADSVVTEQVLGYNRKNMQVNRQIATSSKGQTLDEYIYFAVDSAASGNTTAVWDTLIKRNIIAIPLKTVSQVNGATTSTFINKYAQASGSGYMQLKELWHGYLSNAPTAKVLFNYTSSDNLAEQQKADDVKEVYLWGYNDQYPVAKILNSTYAVASTYITTSVLNNPSSDAALRTHLNSLRSISGALVTTYTYKSGVGLSSETDPNGRTTYYEYDNHNRLSLVRDHDGNILKKICYNYAGQPATCGLVTYSSAAASGTFTRNNCGTNGTGSSVTYTVAASAYSSVISQGDADQQATADVNNNGQNYANANGSCTWTNEVQSGSFTRNDCGTNGTGSAVTYTVAAGTYSSTVSLADANQQATNAVNAGGQAYANANAGCTWTNEVQSSNFIRNNCVDGGAGSTMTYWVYAGAYSSTISLADANQQALDQINTYGQNYVNANASCTWFNDAQSGNFTRNNCGAGYVGSTMAYTINSGSYSSTVSKADANQQAVNALNSQGQSYVNTNGNCTLSVYAKLSYENYNYSYSNAVHADVVVRFYSDAACTQPVSVSSLTINLSTEGFDGSSTFSYDFSETANGTYHVLGYTVELSYDDGSTNRFRDYYLLGGSFYTVVW